MCVVAINIPEEILLDIHEDRDDFADYHVSKNEFVEKLANA